VQNADFSGVLFELTSLVKKG